MNTVGHSILGLGLVAAAEGKTARAVTLLTFGLTRSGAPVFLLGEPQRVLASLKSELSPAEFAVAETQAKKIDLAGLMNSSE